MNDSRTDQQASVVSRCDATTCRYNEQEQCMAGQIEVSLNGQMAQCLTFSPEDGLGDMDSQRPTSGMD